MDEPNLTLPEAQEQLPAICQRFAADPGTRDAVVVTDADGPVAVIIPWRRYRAWAGLGGETLMPVHQNGRLIAVVRDCG